jgi:sn1-specific diacylglycerol lipase
MSKESARQDFVTTFVLDSDIVPRLSLHSIEALRCEVLQAIARIKVPKHKLRSAKDDDILCSISQVPESHYAKQLEALRIHLETKSSEREDVRLVLPGARFIHLVKAFPEESDRHGMRHGMLERTKRASYVPVWAEPADFREIGIRKNMFIDHTPGRLVSQFESAIEPFLSFEAQANKYFIPKI